ncbi:chitinase-like protein Idgf4 isoform X1 [Diabrotica virgifera virgifera]|uniref:GH18 domain-containing protein n=1 Tax=Diabrotica virgifera virgifera TaxID=50390 RepID=A0ABM5KJK2_DIAVI|nr:chitinase-like protein Idgf4 isoform X1 [Diabrotica virgifera virgifera]
MAAGFKIFLLVLFSYVCYTQANPKVVCYYDEKGNSRQGQGKFDVAFLEPALQFCTHLIYGYAGIDPNTYKIKLMNEQLDLNQHNFRQVTDLKRKFPGLRVFLSVGGDRDVSGEDTEKNMVYRNVLEAVDRRLTFINSAKDLIKNYGFDGIDLAWEMPRTKPKKIFGTVKNFLVGIKRRIVGSSVVDDKADEHREQFTAFIREFKNALRHDGFWLTLSVLPNVNSTVYYDPRALAPHLDFVTLQNFDFYTPERNPKEADYSSPLYKIFDRKDDENGDFQVMYWLNNGMPANKILYGIRTFGRSWKMTQASGLTGVPPLTIEEAPGEAGPYTQEPGLLSYNEVCTKIANPTEIKAGYVGKLRKVNDPTKRMEIDYWNTTDVSKRFGTYAFREPKNGQEGIWVSFEDPDTAGQIGSYVKAKGIGGVSIVDLSLDDFRGLCTGDKYPILRAAKFRL